MSFRPPSFGAPGNLPNHPVRPVPFHSPNRTIRDVNPSGNTRRYYPITGCPDTDHRNGIDSGILDVDREVMNLCNMTDDEDFQNDLSSEPFSSPFVSRMTPEGAHMQDANPCSGRSAPSHAYDLREVPCKYNGCTFVDHRCNILFHESQCPWRTTRCRHCDSVILKSTQNDHVRMGCSALNDAGARSDLHGFRAMSAPVESRCSSLPFTSNAQLHSSTPESDSSTAQKRRRV